MIEINLPDGKLKKFSSSITAADLADTISPSLSKSALLAKVNDQIYDLSIPLKSGSRVTILTRQDELVLPYIRHSCAHVLAEAVQNIFSDVQIAFGPSTKEGFYYDFYRVKPFIADDLSKIETEMRRIIAINNPFRREIWNHQRIRNWWIQKGETFKTEYVDNISTDEPISVYFQGEWMDMCRGPHLPSTGVIGDGFTLTKLAGVYWRGNPDNAQLQRIYGICWRDKKELQVYQKQIIEIKFRDHRKLGQEMELFHIQDEAAGSVFWHPKGWKLYNTIQDYIRTRQRQAGYIEVKTPQLLNQIFWKKSGHWDKYRDNMFVLSSTGNIKDNRDDKTYALKPMNCPCHVMIFRQSIKSYRDLPLKIAEFGACHRNEASGALHGLMRLRAFTQDDAHIFCTPEQIESETEAFCQLLNTVYCDFGFRDIKILFSDRPKIRAGKEEIWEQAEQALSNAAKNIGITYQYNPGDGAFYGPKLDFVLRDAIGREWQCGTLQCDFILSERLDASYIGQDGRDHRPVILHRAIIGSFERFCGILIEHYAGKIPMWLSPVQIKICPISQVTNTYAKSIHRQMLKSNLRAEIDLRNEKIGYKIRDHILKKIPIVAIVGPQEVKDNTVVLRYLYCKKQETLLLDEAIALLNREAIDPLITK